MKRTDYRGSRCEKRQLSKCADGVCKTYSVLESRTADLLEADENVREFRCNVPLEGLPEGNYCSDFVCVKTNGELMVREWVWRKNLMKPRTLNLLDASLNYWRRHGVEDWGLAIDKKKEETDATEKAD